MPTTGKKPQLGPWTQGVVLTQHPEDVQAFLSKDGGSGLIDAVNVDIDRNGWITNRPSWMPIDAFEARDGYELNGVTWAVTAGHVAELTGGGPINIMSPTGKVSWTHVNAEPVFADYNGIYVIQNRAATQLTLTTAPDERDDRVLASMPGGTAIAAWRGRLVVARGTSLYFSEPEHFGAYDTVRGVLSNGHQVRWLQAVESGLYVGFKNSVEFLGGTNPYDLERTVVDVNIWDAAGILIPTDRLSPDIAGGAAHVAVWFGEQGFVIGQESGNIVKPQQDRIDGLSAAKGVLSYNSGRLIVRKALVGA